MKEKIIDVISLFRTNIHLFFLMRFKSVLTAEHRPVCSLYGDSADWLLVLWFTLCRLMLSDEGFPHEDNQHRAARGCPGFINALCVCGTFFFYSSNYSNKRLWLFLATEQQINQTQAAATNRRKHVFCENVLLMLSKEWFG